MFVCTLYIACILHHLASYNYYTSYAITYLLLINLLLTQAQ